MCDSKSIEKNIIGYFAETLRKDEKELNSGTKIKEELGCKSMQMIAVLARVKEGLGVSIQLIEASKAVTIGEFTEKIAKKL